MRSGRFGLHLPAARIDASIPEDTPISSGLQKRGAKAKAANSMKPTKKGPMIVKAMPILFVLGVREAQEETKATMPNAEIMSQYRVFPKALISPPAATWPSAVAADTVHLKFVSVCSLQNVLDILPKANQHNQCRWYT